MDEGTNSSSTAEFKTVMMKMMESMHAKPYTGDTDVDFVTQMIPHHQGAIDSAKIELKYGTDPELRDLAKSIIQSQQKESEFQKEWLKRQYIIWKSK
jgi:uncharacterized protein (DUF305 family)